jgi:hypothetical protein
VSRLVELRPLDDVIADIRDRAEQRRKEFLAYLAKETEEHIALVEQNRQACALRDGAGIDLELPSWNRGMSVRIDLGFFPWTKAGRRRLRDQLIAIRKALDVKKLKMTSKSEADEFPGITGT